MRISKQNWVGVGVWKAGFPPPKPWLDRDHLGRCSPQAAKARRGVGEKGVPTGLHHPPS